MTRNNLWIISISLIKSINIKHASQLGGTDLKPDLKEHILDFGQDVGIKHLGLKIEKIIQRPPFISNLFKLFVTK